MNANFYINNSDNRVVDKSLTPLYSISTQTGTFTTGSNQYEKVEVVVGFKPTYIKVILPFSNGDTTAIYDASISTTTSTWTIPMEHRTYTIDIGSVTGETGITDITNTGFKFRCNAPNTRNVLCTYEANTEDASITVIFKDNEDKGAPTLELAYSEDFISANYCYIEELGHYYYLTEPVLGAQRMIFTAKSDLLMTYKDEILELGCIIARQENKYNAYMNDNRFPVSSKQDVTTLLFPSGFSEDHEELLVVVNGGGGVQV